MVEPKASSLSMEYKKRISDLISKDITAAHQPLDSHQSSPLQHIMSCLPEAVLIFHI